MLETGGLFQSQIVYPFQILFPQILAPIIVFDWSERMWERGELAQL